MTTAVIHSVHVENYGVEFLKLQFKFRLVLGHINSYSGVCVSMSCKLNTSNSLETAMAMGVRPVQALCCLPGNLLFKN